MRTRTKAVAAAAVLGVAAAGMAVWAWGPSEAGQPGGGPDQPAASRPAAPTGFVVDTTLQPAVATVAGLRDGEPPRPVGRLLNDGVAADLVLDEFVVGAPDRASLQPLLDRWSATVADESDGVFLLRFDPSDVDTSGLAADMAVVEPGLSGMTGASSDRTLRMLAALAAESARHGTTVAPNWIVGANSIEDGRVIEGVQSKPNAFDWSFIRTGGAMDTGVGAAWQLLDQHDKLGNAVPIMISDGGFVENKDFPAKRTIRKGEWGYSSRYGWHGTNVTLTAMGQLDNQFGTAGPAGPVGELIAVPIADGTYDTLKRIRDVVDEERPAILNMSWGEVVTHFQSATRATYDRFLRAVHERGVLTFAAAGNENRNVDAENCIGSTCWEGQLTYPCESAYAICVGGLDSNSQWKAPNSNYGSDSDNETVEIYGPHFTVGLVNPKYPDTETVGGTSFASPFVAGVAALVKAAKPGLARDGIWEVVRETAHHDGVGLPWVIDGHKRRINALDAVARALGVEQGPPEVRIESPTDGKTLAPGTWLDLEGSAVDFKGTTLPIRWTADGGDVTGQPTTLPTGLDLTAADGEHVITATAVDINGRSTTVAVRIRIERPAPKVKIVSPSEGQAIYQTVPVDLFGWTNDPAANAQLADSAVSWTVRRVESAGKVVHSATGHLARIPAGKLAPGTYVAEFTGDNGTAVTAQRQFIVKSVPPGQTVPVVRILKPTPGTKLTATEGHPAPLQLAGTANDKEDGNLPGTRFRWTATDPNGKVTVLCQGTAVPGSGPGGVKPGGEVAKPGDGPVLVTPTDCSSATAGLLSIDGGKEGTLYRLTLDAWDSSGLMGSANVDVRVVYQAL